MNKKKLLLVIEKLSEYFGKPVKRRSNSRGILDVLIATKLSQNTTDKSAFTAFTNLKNRFSTWEEVAAAGLNEIRDCIRVCGLSNTKAANIKLMLQEMRQEHNDLDFSFLKKYSDDEVYEEFLKYKGIGIKTISCVLVFALGRDAFPVDTHVHRVLNRLGVVKTGLPEKTFNEVNNFIPEGRKYELHNNLIKFGRNICRAKNPLCSACFLYGICEFKDRKIYRKKKLPAGERQNNFIILEHV